MAPGAHSRMSHNTREDLKLVYQSGISKNNIVFCFALTSTGGISSQLFLYWLEEGRLYSNLNILHFFEDVGGRLPSVQL